MIVSRKMAEDAFLLLTQWPGQYYEFDKLDTAAVAGLYKRGARATHPDAGGDAAQFAAVDHAKHVLLAWLDRQGGVEEEKPHGGVAKCPRCDGKGYLELRGARLGSVMRKQCPTCQGNGEIYDEKNKDGDRI